MKFNLILAITTLCSFIFFTSCETSTSGADITTLNNQTDSLSYAIGISLSQNLKQSGFDSLNYDAMAQAMKDLQNNETPVFDELQAQTVVQNYMMSQQAELMKAQAAQAGPVKEAGRQFLADNATKEGVQTTTSGLQYLVLNEGNGKSPVATDNVTVHYHGTLIDGTVFDSSVDRGQPATFALNQVIPGWTEGLQLMKEGAKYRFFIPSELAYGDRAAGELIQPGSTLIFDVDLISVN